MLTGVRRYLVESWAELKKVAWPTRETVIRLTVLVIGVSAAVGLYIFVLDTIFNSMLDAVLARKEADELATTAGATA